MKTKEISLQQGGVLRCYLRTASDRMPMTQTRPAVVVIPGGGYNHGSAREADPVALQFAAAGYHTFVLEYGLLDKAQHYLPMKQAAEALGVIRAHAVEWGVQPQKIAVCGFSAGGHLALASAVLDIPGEDPAYQPRPNAVILGYPVVTAGEYAHRGSFCYLTGSDDPAAHAPFGLEDKIRAGMPPVFVWHGVEDDTVPVENTLLLVAALRRAGVPFEAHLFPLRQHGTSICTPEMTFDYPHAAHWVELAQEWLADVFEFHTR
jgi:acetyl esterase/lipase